MMNNSVKIIKIDLMDFIRATHIWEQGMFYKNGNLKPRTINLITLVVKKVAENLQMNKVLVDDRQIEYIRDFNKAEIRICPIRKDIRIIFDWEKMEFDRHSDYNNVYDFETHYTKVLASYTQYLLEQYGLLALIF